MNLIKWLSSTLYDMILLVLIYTIAYNIGDLTRPPIGVFVVLVTIGLLSLLKNIPES